MQVAGFTAHVQDLDTVYKCFHKVPNDGVAPVSRFQVAESCLHLTEGSVAALTLVAAWCCPLRSLSQGCMARGPFRCGRASRTARWCAS